MAIMKQNVFEYASAEYLIALADGTVTDELRQNVVVAASTYNLVEYVYSQVFVAYMQMIVSKGLTQNQVLEGIRTEFDAFDMAEMMGTFSQYEKVICDCAYWAVNSSACLETCLALIEGLDEQSDAVKYGLSIAVLRHISFARQVVDNLETVRHIMNVINSYDEVPVGANAVKHIAEFAINYKPGN